MKAKEAVFSRRDAETQRRRDAETQREVLDRINRIDRIDGSGDSNALQSNLDTPCRLPFNNPKPLITNP